MVLITDFSQTFKMLGFKSHIYLSFTIKICLASAGYWVNIQNMKSLITAKAELQVVQGKLKARRVAAGLGSEGNKANLSIKCL